MTVILVDPRRPSLVPVEAIALLGDEVQYTEEMPVVVPWSLAAAHPVHSGPDAPVLLSSDRDHPAVSARLAAGERLIAAPAAQAGERLVDTVAMMDKLRTAGPWESEQTHDSLRRFLLEETYELFDAVRSGDADALREELGDVLLQVLFHARIAEDAAAHPFTIDDVADALVKKLVNRVPAVLAGEEISLEEQLAQWEKRKALEKKAKPRTSMMDDVPTGQPALALAQKAIRRVCAAGFPPELIPSAITSIAVPVDSDADVENCLRSAVLEFMDTVRRAEKVITAARRGSNVPDEFDVAVPAEVTEQEWRACWPVSVDQESAGEVEPAPSEASGESEESSTESSDDPGGGEVAGQSSDEDSPAEKLAPVTSGDQSISVEPW